MAIHNQAYIKIEQWNRKIKIKGEILDYRLLRLKPHNDAIGESQVCKIMDCFACARNDAVENVIARNKKNK